MNINKILTLSIVVASMLLIIFFAHRITEQPKPIRSPHNNLVVSILPVKQILKSIVDEDFEITVLVPPGSSPEIYEPTPQQLMSISNAMLIFNIGLLDFEQELIKRLPGDMKNKVINLSEDINLLAGSCSGIHKGHHHGGIDPHIWTSPRQLKKMTETTYSAIHTLYPDSVKYKENYELFIARLDELDKQTAQLISDSNVKHFFIYHPALTYYANDYNIEQVSIEKDGKEPSAEQLKNLIELARAENIATILYQREFNRSTVETIADDIGARAIMIDPLAEDITNSIRQITNLIAYRKIKNE